MVAVLAIACLLGDAAAAGAEPTLSPAPGVPANGRAWELVTSAEPIPATLWLASAFSADGTRLAYQTVGPLPGSPTGKVLVAGALSRRTAGGWVNEADLPPHAETDSEPEPIAFSPDLRNSIWHNKLPDGRLGLFLRTPTGDTLMAGDASFPGASVDLRHVFIGTPEHLLAADSTRTSGASIYEFAGSSPRLVDVADDGALLSDCGSTVGGESPVSDDGRRIFFTTAPGCGATSRVFMRAGGTSTVEISASRCDLPDCGEPAAASFAGASPDGMHAYLITAERLTDDDPDPEADLYRYDVASGQLSLIPMSWNGQDLVPSGEVVASGDGSYAYCFGNGPEGRKLFVIGAGAPRVVPGVDPDASLLQLAANGRYALISSSARLTAADEDDQADLYRYDAETGALVLISTGPQGGNGPFGVTINPISAPGGIEMNAQGSRAMSEDGGHVFFRTEEELLPGDRNEANDAYEWANGSLGLISAGVGPQHSYFTSTTPDGGSVLFRTAATLVPEDVDGGDWDFYVARVGGGFTDTEPSPSCACATTSPGARARARTGGPAGRRILLHRIGARDRRRIAVTGWITLLVEAPREGKLSALALARLGHGRRVVAATSAEVRQAGPVRLRMRLSPAARRRLASGRALGVGLSLRLSGLAAVHRAHFQLRASG